MLGTKMNSINFFLLSGLLAAVLVVEVSSIKCFQCNSQREPECSDIKSNHTDSLYYRECVSQLNDFKSFFCRKTAQNLMDGSENKRVIRSCGWIVYKERTPNCRKSISDFRKEESCQCFTDGCNSANTKALSVFVAPLLFFIYFKL